MLQSTLPTCSSKVSVCMLGSAWSQRVIWKHRGVMRVLRPAPSQAGSGSRGPGGPSQVGPRPGINKKAVLSVYDSSRVVCFILRRNVTLMMYDQELCNCYFFIIYYEHIRIMWVFKRFSVSTRPLTKVLIHFSVSQTQIVLDGHSFFYQNPPDFRCKGNNKKSWSFGIFCLSQFVCFWFPFTGPP